MGLQYKKVTTLISCMLLVYSYIFSPTQAVALNPLNQSQIFDLNRPVVHLFQRKALYERTVLQSFAFDNINRKIYTVQLMPGGKQLSNEKGPISGAKRALSGDLVLTKLDLNGNKQGYMYLKGFGHGVSIGVESQGNQVYIWIESDAKTSDGESGWGSSFTRFLFENGKTLSTKSGRLEKFFPVPGAEEISISIDQAYDILVMQYKKDNVFHFRSFAFSQVKKHHFKVLADVHRPKTGIFQGFASFGRYLYTLEGTPYGYSGSVKPIGNTYITIMDLLTGKVIEKRLITVASELPYREPEGMDILIDDIHRLENATLYFGLASTVSASNKSKLVSLYGYNQFLKK